MVLEQDYHIKPFLYACLVMQPTANLHQLAQCLPHASWLSHSVLWRNKAYQAADHNPTCVPLCQCMFASACISTAMQQSLGASSINNSDNDSCLFTESLLVVLSWHCSVSAQESVMSQRSFYAAATPPFWTATARVQSKASLRMKALGWPTTQHSVRFASSQFNAAATCLLTPYCCCSSTSYKLLIALQSTCSSFHAGLLSTCVVCS